MKHMQHAQAGPQTDGMPLHDAMSRSGLYIVELGNEHPISVNAHDPRIADRCIAVCRGNIKIGKAKSLAGREKNYCRTFGEQHVRFRAIALTLHIVEAEQAVLRALSAWRLRGRTGRRNEWLAGIAADAAERLALAALRAAGIAFAVPGVVDRLAVDPPPFRAPCRSEVPPR